MMYYVLMNGKRSVHTYTEAQANKLMDQLKGLFHDLIIKKEQVL